MFTSNTMNTIYYSSEHATLKSLQDSYANRNNRNEFCKKKKRFQTIIEQLIKNDLLNPKRQNSIALNILIQSKTKNTCNSLISF